jgi:hypothetical protein
MNSNSGKSRATYPPRQTNINEVDEVVDVDDIIDYTMLNQDATGANYDDKRTTANDDGLLAYMAGLSSSTGDIRICPLPIIQKKGYVHYQ